jgi:hypothetical protein
VLAPAVAAEQAASEVAVAAADVAVMATGVRVVEVAPEVVLVEAEPRRAEALRRCHEFACRTRSIGAVACCSPRSGKYSVGCSTPAPAQIPVFSHRFLYLSRACLGKMIFASLKWLRASVDESLLIDV